MSDGTTKQPSKFHLALRAIKTARSHQFTAPHRMILIVLADYIGDGSECFPSLTTLAADIGVSRRNVQRLLSQLEAGVPGSPFQVVRRDAKPDEPQSTHYRLTPTRDTVSLGTPCPHGRDTMALVLGTPCPPPRDTMAPDPLRDPLMGSSQGTFFAAGAAGTPPRKVRKGSGRAPKPKPVVEAEPSSHQQVKQCYFDEFRRARQADRVPFEGREAKAVNELVRKAGGPEQACAVIRNAFAGFFKSSASILTIANDPAKFTGNVANGTRKHLVQHDDGAPVYDSPVEEVF